MTPTDDRPAKEHHWMALWLLLIGGAWFVTAEVGSAALFGCVLMGAGFVWLMLVE